MFTIHPDTIHFDDVPWGVKGYIYGAGEKYLFIVPEEVISRKTRVNPLKSSDMIKFVQDNKAAIEKYCSRYLAQKKKMKKPISNNGQIIIMDI